MSLMENPDTPIKLLTLSEAASISRFPNELCIA